MLVMATPKQGVGEEDAALAVFGVGHAGRRATITAPIVLPPSLGGQFTLPLPVEPVVGRMAHAAPTALPLLPTLDPMSKISVNVVGLLVVAQVLKLLVVDGAPKRDPAANMTIALLTVTGETAVIPVIALLVDVVIPVGTVTSNGFEVLTPENATIAPAALSLFDVIVKAKLVALTSEAVATFDSTVAKPRPDPMLCEDLTVQPEGPDAATFVAFS
jgi:hypothetical protein